MSSKKKTDEAAAPEAVEATAQVETPQAAPPLSLGASSVAASEGKKPPAAQKTAETPQKATESAPDPLDWVKVRFTGEMGLLAGRAVYGGEVHRVRYWQYLRARETGGEAYQLVEE
jgi:hypothetical protein